MTNGISDVAGLCQSPGSQQAIEAVTAALKVNDIDKAIELARTALNEGVVHPLLLNLRAYWLEKQDELDQSLADLERARAMAPDDLTVLNALGLCLGKMGRWDEAIVICDSIIAALPDFAPAHYNKGWNHEFRGDLEIAIQCYDKALAINPRYAEPLSRSAGLAARRGAWDEADALAERALAIDDTQFFALQSQIRAALARKNHDLAEQLIARHLGDSRARPLDQALTKIYLADLRHAQGRYAEAFLAYQEGNAQQIEIFAPRFRRPNRQTAGEYAVWITEYVEKAPASRIAADRMVIAPEDTGEPFQHVFLVGSPRSGTTLLENVLISHPRIVSLEERPLLKDALDEFMSSDWGLQRLTAPTRRDISKYRRLYWDRVRRDHVEPQDKVFIDKNPLNVLNLAAVAKLFPRAKVLFALRDPRDVVLSCFRYTFLMNRSMFEYLTLEGTARFYDTLMRIGVAYREKVNLDWHELRNEDLITDFEGETRKICDFIGVDWSAEILKFAEHAKSRYIATPSATQVMRGISREGMGQWRNYAKELEPVLPFLKPWVERFGYPPD